MISKKLIKPLALIALILALLFILIWTGYRIFFKKETLRIALVGPMTGELASVGKSFQQGIELYLKQINEKGGIDGKKIALDVYDDQNNPRKAKAKALEIVNDKRAVAVIGHHYSSCSISAGGIYQRHGIPAISPASTNVDVTLDNDWYFRSSFNDDIQGRFLASYARNVLGQNRVSIIHDKDPYGSFLASVFERTSRAMDVEVRRKWTFETGSQNLDQDLEKIVNELLYDKDEAGVIFLATHAAEGARLMKLIKDKTLSDPLRNPLMGPDAFSSEAFLRIFTEYPEEKKKPGFYTDELYVTTPLIFDTTSEKGLKFKETYEATYQEKSGWHAAFAYDTMMVIAEAIRSTGIQGGSDSLKSDRRKIRDWLANLSDMYDAVEGVTGYNYFDENGDSQKQVFIGVYQKQNLISALTQLQAIPNANEVPNFEQALETGLVVEFDNRYFYKINVVHTGIHINEITNLDIKDFTYDLDFYLWFRYQGDIKVENIEFVNAVDPIQLSKPDHTEEIGKLNYRLYNVKGRFRADFRPNLHIFGQHILGVSFRHHEDRSRLILVQDVLGMHLKSRISLEERMRQEGVLNAMYGWQISEVLFSQDIAEKSTLGNPKLFNLRDGKREYSQFNAVLRIVKDEITVRRTLPNTWGIYLLALSFLTTVLLAYFVKGSAPKPLPNLKPYAKMVWFFQIAFIYLLLLTSEVLILSQLSEKLTASYFGVIVKTFDIFWWLITAHYISIWMERFVWLPVEEKTQQPIPNIIRGLISLIIYLLAIMAIIAFVFGQALTGILATGGMISLIIGLALQMNLANIFSGIAINVERPFRIDDWVKIGSFKEGKVSDINWRTTKVSTRDGTILSIPNNQVSESYIENFSQPDRGYWKYFTIHVDPGHHPERVKKILLNAALATADISKRISPATRFLGLTAGMTGQSESWAANYLISVYVEDYGMKFAHNEMIWLNVWTHLKHAGIKHVMTRHDLQMSLVRKKAKTKDSGPLDLLRASYLFKPFNEETKRHLSKLVKKHRLANGELVFRQGDMGDSMFIIAEGAVGLRVLAPSGDKEIEVGRMGTGEVFGEMALLTGEERTATVVAISDTRLFEITKEHIYPLIKAQPEISKLLSDVVSQRKMDTEAKKEQAESKKIDKETLAKQILDKMQKFFGFKGD